MDMTNTILIAAAVAIVVGLAVHLYHVWPKNTPVTSANVLHVVKDDAVKIERSVETDALNGLTQGVAWLTDKTSEKAKIAEAQASMALKDAMLDKHIAALQAAKSS